MKTKMKSIKKVALVTFTALLLALCVGCNSNPTEVVDYGLKMINDLNDSGTQSEMSLEAVFYSNKTFTFTQTSYSVAQTTNSVIYGTYDGDPTKDGTITGAITAMNGQEYSGVTYRMVIRDEKIKSFIIIEASEQMDFFAAMETVLNQAGIEIELDLVKGGRTIKFSELNL